MHDPAKECCVYGSAISGDGSRVAFQSANGDIVPGGTLGSFDTYVRDFATGLTQRVSVASDGTPSVGSRQYPNIFNDVTNLDMSSDGRYVAFTSNAANLVPGDTNGTWDVFVHDLKTGTTERVSVATGGAQMSDGGISPDISADGRYIAFASDGLFVHDRATGATERVDVSSSEEPANFYGYGPSVSDDGRWVAFQSSASNLVTDPTEAVFASGAAIYLRDRVTGTTTRVTGPAQDTKANGYSWMPDISGDGRYIAFYSAATDLIPQDTNRADDVFVFDRITGATRRVSVASDGSQASPTGSAHAGALETSGTGLQSVQRRRRGAPIAVLSSTVSRTGDRVDVNGTAGFAGAVVSAADDSASPAPALDEPGADVTRAELTIRTEAEDLRFRITTPGLPGAQVSGLAGRLACFETGCPPSVATSPYVGYRLDFSVAGVPHRLVIDAAGAVLSQCATACVPLGAATAQVGGTGQEVVVTVPLSLLGGAHDQPLTGISASSTLVGSVTGTAQDLDTVTLPNSTLASPQVQLAVIPAGRAPLSSDYTRTASLTGSTYTGTATAPPATSVDVWLRPCVGAVCGRAVTRALPLAADPVVPEAPYVVLLPLAALAIAGAVLHRRAAS